MTMNEHLLTQQSQSTPSVHVKIHMCVSVPVNPKTCIPTYGDAEVSAAISWLQHVKIHPP